MNRRHPPRPDERDRTDRESRWAAWAWCAAFLLLVFLVGCVEIEDPDIWWHLRTGQLIWQRGEIPLSDWFTYTNPNSPWIDLHWGFQLVAAALWAIGGAAALVVTKSALAVATFALLFVAGRANWPAWQTVACLLPSLVIFAGRNQVRPEMFSLLFLAAELAILFHAPNRPRLLWLLPLIQVLWINVHALYVLGLVLWACFALGQIANRNPRTSTSEDCGLHVGAIRRLLAITALMLGAALVNPYGWDGALFPLALVTRIEGPDHAFYTQFSGEFRGLGEFIAAYGIAALLHNLTTAMLMLLFVLTALSFVVHGTRRRLDVYRLAIFVLFAWLAWKANRNAFLFGLVAGAVLRANVGDWFEAVRERPHGFAVGQVVTAVLLGVLIIGVPFDLLSVMRPAEIRRWFGVGEIPEAFPHEAAEFLGREGMPLRCYAIDEGAAAVFIFHNGPERKVFADARLEVNTRETLERYLAIERQLTGGDPRVITSLKQGIPPDGNGVVEVPALLISLRYLAANPALQQGLARLTQFRRVYVDYVAVVFIEEKQAEALGLDTKND